MSDSGEVTAQVERILSRTEGLAPGTSLSPAYGQLVIFSQVCMEYSGHQSCLTVHTGYFVLNPGPSPGPSFRVILAFPHRVPF